MARGPGTNEEQIKSLREKLGEDGVQAAEAIAEGVETDVIALAYKITRSALKNKLPKSVANLVDKLPEADAERVRGQLLGVK